MARGGKIGSGVRLLETVQPGPVRPIRSLRDVHRGPTPPAVGLVEITGLAQGIVHGREDSRTNGSVRGGVEEDVGGVTAPPGTGV